MPNYQGLYVDNLCDILGNAALEDALLQFAQSKSFSTLSLYDIQKILQKGNITSPATDALAAFIKKARCEYGMMHIAGIAENTDFFKNVISVYNNLRTDANEKFDVYNMEFEFWNPEPIALYYCSDYLTPAGLACNTDGAFTFFKQQFTSLHALAKKDNCVCETYVGKPTAAQAKGMLPYADRILMHAYVTDPATAYNYTKQRLRDFANAGKANIMIIFSAEQEFSGMWLQTHDHKKAYEIFLAKYNADPQPWKKNITLLGYQWYNSTNFRGFSGIT